MRAVLFDMFNTLVPGGSQHRRDEVTACMARLLGVDPHAYVRAFADTRRERFLGATGDATRTVRLLAQRVAGDPSQQQAAAAVALRKEMTAELLAAAPDTTRDTLDRLRAAGWQLGLVSNATSESPDRFRGGPLASRFNATAFSCELGVAKPDPALYLAACGMLGVPPPACIYVGDGADQELPAAAALGMHAVRTTEHADSDPGWDGPTVRSVADLPALLSSAPDLRAAGLSG